MWVLVRRSFRKPSNRHENTNCFLFFPKKLIDHFSPYMMETILQKYKPTDKLIKDQTSKKRYFIQGRDIKFFAGHGIKNIKRHTVYRFKQGF